MSERLAEYYARRAREYDAIYQKPERQEDIGRLGEILVELLAGRRVLEVACGTGFWTRRGVERVASITAVDINEEVLALARERLAGDRRVRFLRGDAFRFDGAGDGYSGAL